VTAAERRLSALAAALAPARCAALCSRAGGSRAARLSREAVALAPLSRAERLRALALSLDQGATPASVVAAWHGFHPLLRRLAAESRG
jgi:hypothetical protein